MESFRQNILQQIKHIETGRIFTFRDLSFDCDKRAYVAVLLSDLTKNGELVRLEKGVYYRPRLSALGLGQLPVYQDEQFRYLTRKLDGYITGAYIYNKMKLTEQVATTVTFATTTPVRRFRFRNLDIECVKAYCPDFHDERLLPYLRLLDALKDIKNIPGTTQQEVFDRVLTLYFSSYTLSQLSELVSLSKYYPPRVRKVVYDLLSAIGQSELCLEMKTTLSPTTRFNLKYSSTLKTES
jgi:hypothetical protein